VQGQEGRVAAIWPQGVAKPTADKPQLAMVLVPRTGQAPAPGNGQGAAPAPAPAWVFPFSKPSPPGDGGNQALAVNTKDGSVVYDVAFAMVWVQDGSALNVNEADAFASCRDCAAVAVAFQVVLVVGQVHAVVPQNLAVAANYNCTQCLAYAVANQLVLTLDQPLSPAGMAQLSTLWDDIIAFQATIQDQPLTQIQARLNQYAAQIRQIIQQDPSSTHQAPSSAAEATEPAAPSGAPASSAPTPAASVPDTVTAPSTSGAGAPAVPASEAPAQTTAPGSTDAPPSPAPAETAMPVPTASP
jgi:putative peptide zinc metalloprotease protein